MAGVFAYVADQEPTPAQRDDASAGRDQVVGDVEGTFHQLHVLDLRTKKAWAVSPRDRSVSQVTWAPRGERLAVVASDRPLRCKPDMSPHAPQGGCETVG